jgi:hypothetical protein
MRIETSVVRVGRTLLFWAARLVGRRFGMLLTVVTGVGAQVRAWVDALAGVRDHFADFGLSRAGALLSVVNAALVGCSAVLSFESSALVGW